MRLVVIIAVLAGCAAPVPAVQDPPNTSAAAPIVTPQAASADPTSTEPARSLTVAATGDILIHPSLWSRAQADGTSFVAELAGVKPRISKADYAVCHVEQGFNDPSGPVSEYPDYYTHPALAEAISATGFQTCSTASNWTYLKGLEGIARTNRALSQADVAPAGSRAKPSQDLMAVQTVKGVTVAHISATDPADSPAVPGAPWAINRARAGQIIEQAAAARGTGAELVIASLSMGDMGPTTPNDTQQRTVRRIAESEQVDLVIGHGSHTIQGAQKLNGMWVIWHGNLLSSFFPEQRRMHEGLISTVTFVEREDGRFAATGARGAIVLSLPQAGRLIDISAQSCEEVPQRWQEAYVSTADTMAEAVEQGFDLSEPC